MMKKYFGLLCGLLAGLLIVVVSTPVFAVNTDGYSVPYTKNISGVDYLTQWDITGDTEETEKNVLELYNISDWNRDWESIRTPFREAFKSAGFTEFQTMDKNDEAIYWYYSDQTNECFGIYGKKVSKELCGNESGILVIEYILFASDQSDNSKYVSKNNTVTMYAADGRTIEVKSSEVRAYQDVGWYTEPPIKIYAADGRTLYVEPSEVQAYQNVGWYLEPVTTMYADDGRTLVIKKDEVEAYQNVGWYTSPRITMYAADGRSMSVSENEVEAYKNVGWYKEPPTLMYALDGRTLYVEPSEVEAYENVGWYWGKPIKLYSYDDIMYVGQNRMYTVDKSIWDTEPYICVYSVKDFGLDTLYIRKNELDAYKQVGWSDTKPKPKYLFNGNTAKDKAIQTLKDTFKRPGSMEIYDVWFEDVSSDYFTEMGITARYYYIDASGLNGFGGYTRSVEEIYVAYNAYINEYDAWVN